MKAWILIKKLGRKLFDLGIKFIPYNILYRPNGFYWTVNDEHSLTSSEEVTYIEVFPKSNPGIDLNDPYYTMCTEGLKPEPVVSVPAAFIVAIPQGRLQQNLSGTNISVISKNNKLIGELSYQYERSNVGALIYDHAILRQKFFTTPKRYKGVVFSLLSGDVASSNIFHWLYDAYPKLYILKQSGFFDKVDWFLVPDLKHKYHKETLQIIGVKPEKMIACSGYIHLQADTLLVTSHVRHKGLTPTWVCKAHHTYLVEKEAGYSNAYPPFIYIRRGDSKIRQIENEQEVMDMLEEKGFKSYLLSSLPFSEQVKLFSQAKVIVSAHGAGLANLSFCQPGTALVELFAPAYIKPTYQIISRKIGIEYIYIICKAASAKKPRSIREAINQNMKVNLKVLSYQVDRLKKANTKSPHADNTHIKEWTLS